MLDRVSLYTTAFFGGFGFFGFGGLFGVLSPTRHLLACKHRAADLVAARTNGFGLAGEHASRPSAHSSPSDNRWPVLAADQLRVAVVSSAHSLLK